MSLLKCKNHLAQSRKARKEQRASELFWPVISLRLFVFARTAALAFVVIVSLLAVGCARPRPLSVLSDDTINREEGYESVLFWQLRVEDKTGTVSSRPRFLLSRLGQGEKNFDKLPVERIPAAGVWTKQSGVAVYEAMTFAASKPGDYLFSDVLFPLYTDYVANYYTGRYDEREVTFSAPVSRLITVEPGKLIYLGTFVVELLKEEKTGYVYRVRLVQEENDFNNGVKQFRESYPGLFKRFNKTVTHAPAKLFFIDRFSSNKYGWTVPSGDKQVSAAFSDGKYVIESGNDDCHWSGIAPPFELPMNFDVELLSAGKAKNDAAESGIALGTDRENAYNFFLSPDGQAKIELYKDGDVLTTPVTAQAAGSAISSGSKSSVQKIEVRGDALRYFVNDRYVGELKNELNRKDWFLGLAVCGRETTRFDQIMLIER